MRKTTAQVLASVQSPTILHIFHGAPTLRRWQRGRPSVFASTREESMGLSTDMFSRKTRVIVGSVGVLLVAAAWFPVIAAAADAPLSIASQGNFYIGGKYVESNGDLPMVGQAYVQFQIPHDRRHPYPIVMVHGGSQTGSGWISTPDGRGPDRTHTREYAMQRFSTSEKYNLWPQAEVHTQWPGTGDPGDPACDN